MMPSGWWTSLLHPLEPGTWTLSNYQTVLESGGLTSAFINSLIVTIPATVIPITIAAFAAYAFAWIPFRGRGILFTIVIALLVVPIQMSLIPVLKLYSSASLYGTRAANGVITITTKRGSNAGDGIKVGFRSEYGFSDLNSINYGMPVNHQLQLDETGTRFCVAGSANIAPCSRTIDWMKEIMRINNVATDTTRTPVSIVSAPPGSISSMVF